jgi:hypothetical protein
VAGSEREVGYAARLSRYSFEPSTYTHTLDSGYPVQFSDRGVKRLSITKDSGGVLWATFITSGQIWVSHTAGDDASWAPAFPLPAGADPAHSNVHATVAFGDSIGVFWARLPDGAVQFTSHRSADPPDAWTTATAASASVASADNHISARTIDGPDGPTVFAAVKTSFDVEPRSEPSDVQMLVLERRPDGEWRSHIYGRLQDHHTRPLVLIDDERRDLYVFAVSPFGGGSVFYKRTSVDDVVFAHGTGAPFIQVPDLPQITSPTSTKQNVNSASGLVVMAADQATHRYVHGELLLEPSR